MSDALRNARTVPSDMDETVAGMYSILMLLGCSFFFIYECTLKSIHPLKTH